MCWRAGMHWVAGQARARSHPLWTLTWMMQLHSRRAARALHRVEPAGTWMLRVNDVYNLELCSLCEFQQMPSYGVQSVAATDFVLLGDFVLLLGAVTLCGVQPRQCCACQRSGLVPLVCLTAYTFLDVFWLASQMHAVLRLPAHTQVLAQCVCHCWRPDMGLPSPWDQPGLMDLCFGSCV